MIVALIALLVAVGGTATALPGKFKVGRDDLKKSSVGARAIGRALLGHSRVFPSVDPMANDGEFTESEGVIRCPARAPFAFDPSVALGARSAQRRIVAIAGRFGGPVGYRIVVRGDDGPGVGYTMTVNCLPAR